MRILIPFVVLLAGLLTACGSGGPAESTAAAPAQAASVAGVDAAAGEKAIVIRVAPGGSNPGFCLPTWSVANQTGQDIGALLIQLEWRNRAGEVLQPVGEFGTLVEGLAAGRERDRTLLGWPVKCDDLQLVVGRYACRDDNAVRMPCPGPVSVAARGVAADTSAAQEGSMRGAVEGPGG